MSERVIPQYADNKINTVLPLTTAASIALAAMKRAEHTRWTPSTISESGLHLDDHQWDLVAGYANELLALAWHDDFRKYVTIAQCTVCGGHAAFPSGGSVPRSCFLQPSCLGDFGAKARPAKIAPL